MIPILRYLRNIFSYKRIIGDNEKLHGLIKIDALLKHLVDDNKIPGLSITVLKSGLPIFEKGYGYADLELKTAINPRTTIFRIASVSKPIAATALAHMVNEGSLDLDTSFYKYVPYYPKKEWDFTIRQLAGHTAGIRGYQGAEYGLNKPYSIKESLEIFRNDALSFEPGTDYLYTSFDWVLISLAIEEITGIPFEEYVQKKVLKPLGMTNTFAQAPEHSPIATFYSKNRLGFREAIPVNNFYKLAGGGYLSTSVDIAKLGQAYLDGIILDDKILSQFLTSVRINDKPTYYGLGWQVSEDKQGRPYFGHIGNGVGGYSNFLVYPKEQLVVSILVNCTDPKIQDELDVVIHEFMLLEGVL